MLLFIPEKGATALTLWWHTLESGMRCWMCGRLRGWHLGLVHLIVHLIHLVLLSQPDRGSDCDSQRVAAVDSLWGCEAAAVSAVNFLIRGWASFSGDGNCPRCF